MPGANAPLDPLRLALNSSGVVLVVLGLLLIASAAVWLIWFLKILQLGSLLRHHRRFEQSAIEATDGSGLVNIAVQHKSAAGARVVLEMARRRQPGLGVGYFKSIAERALVDEQERASSLMPTLASIASAAPFVGLFGTVWGIMEALLVIGAQGNASLAVVAPAIGEALIATAVGLVAAIPATVGYNYIDRRIETLLSSLQASAETWVELLAGEGNQTSAPREAGRTQPAPPHPMLGGQRFGG
jgi:biopolymer transport protein TolQ